METAAKSMTASVLESLYLEQRLLEAGLNRYRLLGDINSKLNCITKLEIVRQKIARIQNELRF